MPTTSEPRRRLAAPGARAALRLVISSAISSVIALVIASAIALALPGCPPTSASPRAEGVDESQVPADLRADYAIFRARCAKCHSLDRPLGSAIEDEAYWREYVDRMRRQPASGISRADGDAAVRFLLWYHRVYKKGAAGDARDARDAGAPGPIGSSTR